MRAAIVAITLLWGPLAWSWSTPRPAIFRKGLLSAKGENEKNSAERVLTGALAISLVLGNPGTSFALRDVVENQPDIPDKVVPGKTTLGPTGPTGILDLKKNFEMPSIEAPKFGKPSLDMPPIELPKFEKPSFEIDASKFEALKIEAPKIDFKVDAISGAASSATEKAVAKAAEAASKATAAADLANARASGAQDAAATKAAEAAAAAEAQVSGVMGAVESAKQGVQREAMEKARGARKMLYGTAADKFSEANLKEAEAKEAAQRAQESLKKAQKTWGKAKTAASKADALWADMAKREMKSKDQLKGAEATALKAIQVQDAYAQKVKASVGTTYKKAEALRANGDAKGAAALYTEAAKASAELKALPSAETLNGYPPLLTSATAALDPANIEMVRKDFAASMVIMSKAEALTAEATKSAQEALEGAYKAGAVKSGAGLLDGARVSWIGAESDSSSGVTGLETAIKTATALDTEQRSAIKSLGRVHIDEAPQFAPIAKDVTNIATAQADLKTLPNTAAAAEKSARRATENAKDARRDWADSRKAFEEAEKLTNTALHLYADAAELGAQEAALFGETL